MAKPLSACVFGRFFHFASIKEVMNKANERRSGDEQAGLSARSDRERVAAKRVLSELTLEQLFEAPSVPYEDDEVTRVIQDACDPSARRPIAGGDFGQDLARLRIDERDGPRPLVRDQESRPVA